MNFYVRKLGHQECDATEGKGSGHRGRYIFISKKNLNFFPRFDPDSEIRERSLGIINETSNKVTYCFFNWHKGKPFGQSKHLGSDHRLYLNKDSFPSMDHFRKGDYAVFFKYLYENQSNKDYFYKIYRFTVMDSEYNKLEELTYDKHTVRSGRRTFHGLYENLDFIDTSDIKLENFKFSQKAKNKYNNPDSTCHDSHEFREYLRGAYNYQCAVKGKDSSIVIHFEENNKSTTNLEAAHLWPDAWDGPLRPDNGILLSKDLHWCFDRGLFTLNDEFKVVVHDSQKKSDLYKYNGKKIFIPDEEELKPNKNYLEVHRLFVFGTLKPIRKKPSGLKKYLQQKGLVK